MKVGAGVVTTRAHVHYVVTEYGITDLYGKNIAQRAKTIIQIAHPNHREELERRSYDLYGKVGDSVSLYNNFMKHFFYCFLFKLYQTFASRVYWQ